MREVLRARAEQWGFAVRTADTAASGERLVDSFDPHVVISDLVLPDATGLALLERLRAGNPTRTVLLITAYGTIDVAVQAIKGGAADFLTKPLDYVALKRMLDDVDRALATPAPEADPKAAAESFGGMVGASRALVTMQNEMRLAAASDAPVLIAGESGTGKELVARTIHALGERRTGSFVPVNAAALPESLAEAELFGFEQGSFTGATQARAGLFELAHRGTLFLDEITEMPLHLQAKLLRVLEDGSVRRLGARTETTCDVRVIAATNRDLDTAVGEGALRSDLRYRLDVLRVDVPALRRRLDDIPALVHHFVAACAARRGCPKPEVAPEALDLLAEHEWPGNVSELRNAVERAFLVAGDGPITPAHVAGCVQPSRVGRAGRRDSSGIVIPHGVTAAEAERILILETLKATGNNKAEAARRLGMDVKTIRNKLKAFDLVGVLD